MNARNISLFSLGPCGYFYVALDHDPGFFDCYFWGAIIIPNSICFLFLTDGFFGFLLGFFLMIFFFETTRFCLFSLLLAQPGRKETFA